MKLENINEVLNLQMEYNDRESRLDCAVEFQNKCRAKDSDISDVRMSCFSEKLNLSVALAIDPNTPLFHSFISKAIKEREGEVGKLKEELEALGVEID